MLVVPVDVLRERRKSVASAATRATPRRSLRRSGDVSDQIRGAPATRDLPRAGDHHAHCRGTVEPGDCRAAHMVSSHRSKDTCGCFVTARCKRRFGCFRDPVDANSLKRGHREQSTTRLGKIYRSVASSKIAVEFLYVSPLRSAWFGAFESTIVTVILSGMWPVPPARPTGRAGSDSVTAWSRRDQGRANPEQK
jgi:hypothetical protein